MRNKLLSKIEISRNNLQMVVSYLKVSPLKLQSLGGIVSANYLPNFIDMSLVIVGTAHNVNMNTRSKIIHAIGR